MSDRTAPPVYPSPGPFRHNEQSPVGELAQALRCVDEHDRVAFYRWLTEMVMGLPSYDVDRVQAEVEAKWAQRGYIGPDPEAEPLPTVARSIVYYLRFGERVKIGTTTNLAQRLRALPFDEVLATEPGGVFEERARHREFAALRVTGEWFRYEGALREHVETLQP